LNVIVVGASNKNQRYGYMAFMDLKSYGHTVFGVHPKVQYINGDKIYPSINDIQAPVHTITLYVSSRVSSAIADDLIRKAPQRMIFNPGAENPELEAKAREKGIHTLQACTLTLLHTNQFESA